MHNNVENQDQKIEDPRTIILSFIDKFEETLGSIQQDKTELTEAVDVYLEKLKKVKHAVSVLHRSSWSSEHYFQMMYRHTFEQYTLFNLETKAISNKDQREITQFSEDPTNYDAFCNIFSDKSAYNPNTLYQNQILRYRHVIVLHQDTLYLVDHRKKEIRLLTTSDENSSDLNKLKASVGRSSYAPCQIATHEDIQLIHKLYPFLKNNSPTLHKDNVYALLRAISKDTTDGLVHSISDNRRERDNLLLNEVAPFVGTMIVAFIVMVIMYLAGKASLLSLGLTAAIIVCASLFMCLPPLCAELCAKYQQYTINTSDISKEATEAIRPVDATDSQDERKDHSQFVTPVVDRGLFATRKDQVLQLADERLRKFYTPQ